MFAFYPNRNAYLQASEKEKEEARQQNYARQVHLKSLDLLCLAEDMDRPFVIRVNRLSAAGTSGQLPQSGSMANDASTLIGNLGTENTINNSEKRKFASAFDSEDSEDSSKPMSFDEKCHLSSDFGKLSSGELSVVIQILKSKEPIMRDLDPCGIVIDFERLKQSTLRELESCVAFYIGKKTDTPS